MKRKLFISALFIGTLTTNVFAQNKTIVGIMPFTATNQDGYYNRSSQNNYVIAIQDAVSDAFLETKRFTLVEREKMELLRKEKQQQKMEDWLWDNHYSKLPRIHILFEENQCHKE